MLKKVWYQTVSCIDNDIANQIQEIELGYFFENIELCNTSSLLQKGLTSHSFFHFLNKIGNNELIRFKSRFFK